MKEEAWQFLVNGLTQKSIFIFYIFLVISKLSPSHTALIGLWRFVLSRWGRAALLPGRGLFASGSVTGRMTSVPCEMWEICLRGCLQVLRSVFALKCFFFISRCTSDLHTCIFSHGYMLQKGFELQPRWQLWTIKIIYSATAKNSICGINRIACVIIYHPRTLNVPLVFADLSEIKTMLRSWDSCDLGYLSHQA